MRGKEAFPAWRDTPQDRRIIMTERKCYRDMTIGEITQSHIGETLRVAGWIDNIWNHGGVSFLDLRDMYGTLRIVLRSPGLLKGLMKEKFGALYQAFRFGALLRAGRDPSIDSCRRYISGPGIYRCKDVKQVSNLIIEKASSWGRENS